MAHLLIVEDEPDAADLLALHARRAGHEVTVLEDGHRAIAIARTVRPDLLILDHMLPGMTGMEITKAVRADPALRDTPIILLTARAAEEDRVRGFECGADDYVTKPYSMKELMLRIARHLERRKPTVSDTQTLGSGIIKVDLTTQTLLLADETIHLTSIEYKLLIALMRSPDQAVPRTQLLTDVWGYAEGTDTRTLDSHIRRLRMKLGSHAERIETIPGLGFRYLPISPPA